MRKFTEWLKLFEKNKNHSTKKTVFTSKDSYYDKYNINYGIIHSKVEKEGLLTLNKN